MYLEDLALSLAVFLPGFGVYAFLVRPGVLFYPLALLAALGTRGRGDRPCPEG